MSMQLMVMAMNVKVGNPLRKLVLIKLADNANDKGECWPSYQHIADQCEISKRSVMSHVDALCAAGLLIKQTRSGPKGNTTNTYRLHLSRGANAAPGSEGDSLGVVQQLHQGGEADSPGGSAGAAPRTSHSSEPVNEPKPKGRKKPDSNFDPLTTKPANVDEEVWANWCEHRRQIKKPLSEAACALQVRDLERHANPNQVINQSISNGWTGLFPEKVPNVASKHSGFGARSYSEGLGAEQEDGSYAI